MSSSKFPHFNRVIKDPWYRVQFDIIASFSAMQIPYDSELGWPLELPDKKQDNTNTVYIVHLQDSMTLKNGVWLELEKIEKHFGNLSKYVLVIHEEIDLHNYYSGQLNLLWFPTFVYEIAYQITDIDPKWRQYIESEPSKNWQCLNGIPKWFRRYSANWLQKNSSNGILSLANIIPLAQHAYDDVYHGKGNDNFINFLMLDWVYQDCGINVVTETVYDIPGIITEKTLFAFLAGQVPLVIAHKGFVQQCEAMGFDMFTDIIDTSYDNVENPIRWKSALDLNKDILNRGIKRSQYHDRLAKNKQHVLETWPQLLIDTYTLQVNQLLANWNLK